MPYLALSPKYVGWPSSTYSYTGLLRLTCKMGLALSLGLSVATVPLLRGMKREMGAPYQNRMIG